MNIQELHEVLEKTENGNWNVKKDEMGFHVNNIDPIKEYIYALNQRLTALTIYVFWLFLALFIIVIFLANVNVNINVPYIDIFSGWIAGGLLFLFLFVVYSLVNKYHIHNILPKFKNEFLAKSKDLNFTRDMLLTEKWVDVKGGIVKSEILAGILQTEN